MRVDVTNFLISLAAAIATDAGLTLGTNLFVGQGEIAASTAAVCTLTPYGAPSPNEQGGGGVHGQAVQLAAVAGSSEAALAAAELAYRALLDERDLPNVPRAIPAKKKVLGQVAADADLPDGYILAGLAFAQEPAVTGRDPSTGRYRAVFNMELRFGAA
jgi:hypothetical protein